MNCQKSLGSKNWETIIKSSKFLDFILAIWEMQDMLENSNRSLNQLRDDFFATSHKQPNRSDDYQV
jgi:hypothetical protein